MTSAVSGERINLFCDWKGNSNSHGSFVGVVDFKCFDGVGGAVSVQIPQNFASETMTQLPFSASRRVGAFQSPPVSSDCYDVTVEQIRRLSLTAGIFEMRKDSRSVTMDFRTGKIVHSEYAIRSDRVVDLAIPSELRPGGTYRVQIIASESLGLSARLIEVTEAPVTADEGQRELANFLMSCIKNQISLATYGLELAVFWSLDRKTAISIAATKMLEIINGIEPVALGELMAHKKEIEASGSALGEKEIFRACLGVIGNDSVEKKLLQPTFEELLKDRDPTGGGKTHIISLSARVLRTVLINLDSDEPFADCNTLYK